MIDGWMHITMNGWVENLQPLYFILAETAGQIYTVDMSVLLDS